MCICACMHTCVRAACMPGVGVGWGRCSMLVRGPQLLCACFHVSQVLTAVHLLTASARASAQVSTFLKLDDGLLRTIEQLDPEESEHSGAIREAQVGAASRLWLHLHLTVGRGEAGPLTVLVMQVVE